jgi:hypothetical protein
MLRTKDDNLISVSKDGQSAAKHSREFPVPAPTESKITRLRLSANLIHCRQNV